MKNESAGYVYLLKNESMPGLYKIGYTTTSVEQRVNELSRSTGVPAEFECIYSMPITRTITPHQVEQGAHKYLSDSRVSNKEFFKFSSDDDAIARCAFSCAAVINDYLNSEHGHEWLMDNCCMDFCGTERFLLSEHFKDDKELINEAISVSKKMQQAQIEGGRIEEYAICINLDYQAIVDCACYLYLERYFKTPKEAVHCFIHRDPFFNAWMNKQLDRMIEAHSKSIKEKEGS